MARQRRTRLVMVEIDRIVIREVQYQLEVNLCRNEEIKDNFGWVWPIMGGVPQAEIDLNRCRNEEIIVKDNFGLAWPIMWPGRTRVGNGAMHIEIDRIVIREAQYQFEVNQCRNEEVDFQGSSANSVGGAGDQDGRTDAHHHNIPTFSQKKRGDNNKNIKKINSLEHYSISDQAIFNGYQLMIIKWLPSTYWTIEAASGVGVGEEGTGDGLGKSWGDVEDGIMWVVQLLTKFTDTKSVPDRHTDRQTDRPTMRKLYAARETDRRLFKNVLVGCTNAHVSSVSLQQLWLVEHYGYFAEEWRDSDTRLSSDNHLVDGPTDRPTDRPT
ncbi:hypothetical protein DPMN_133902 [Dreissena polymorpha]|uniref:Uncharacterized protein n=1 Tax=Dreissena polymorpha TaxID=45954 RepID=A0A9D4JFA3_DREPO|nr:hypothetical protein DPMN_133902 [Dreissena polymorpha]